MLAQHPLSLKKPFYGRLKGRPLSTEQKALLTHWLPQVLFQPNTKEPPFKKASLTMLEIGFGGGEHLFHLLNTYPNAHILGVEPYQNGIVKALQFIKKDPVLQKRLRLSNQPISELWPFLPADSFDRIYILFPDPWPKKRHLKRRLIQQDTLQQCTRLLKPEGEIRIASDDPAYIAHILKTLNAEKQLTRVTGVTQADPQCWPQWPQDWPLTRYAQKARAQNKPLGHFIFKKHL